jgi:tetratricopeptide (TPR) repeat protein
VLALARAYNGLGRASDAEKRFLEAIALRPDLARAFNLYGAFCFNRSRFEKAVELYQRVVTLSPQSARGFTNLGAAYQALGRYDDALAAHRRAMTLSPTAISYSNLGSCEFSLGRFSDSVASFEKATELTPDNYIFWCNLGDAYRWAPGMRERSLKAYAQATRLARESLAVNPRDAMAHALVASALAKSGKLDDARAEIDTALRIDPTSSVVLYQAGVVAILRGDLRRGSEWVGQALDSGYGAADATRDPELNPIRETVEFRERIAKVRKTS